MAYAAGGYASLIVKRTKRRGAPRPFCLYILRVEWLTSLRFRTNAMPRRAPSLCAHHVRCHIRLPCVCGSRHCLEDENAVNDVSTHWSLKYMRAEVDNANLKTQTQVTKHNPTVHVDVHSRIVTARDEAALKARVRSTCGCAAFSNSKGKRSDAFFASASFVSQA